MGHGGGWKSFDPRPQPAPHDATDHHLDPRGHPSEQLAQLDMKADMGLLPLNIGNQG